MIDQELYQEVILDHYKNPRNCSSMAHPTHSAEGDNPLCGDHLEVFLNVDDNIIKDINFQGSGCAISQASASMMTENLKGHTVEEALDVFDKVHVMLTGHHPEDEIPKELGKLETLSGVVQYPMRVKCASLAWHTLKSALKEKVKTDSTE